ncbi:MAG: hypothetical protein M3N43_04160 [Actinomycetota bacterium]|nr:hypothetical protein [Actinomycetota bacterium]
MTIDPAIVIGAIGAMGALLLFIVRAFATGAILPRSTVPREDYDACVAVVKSYADRFGEQTEAVRALTGSVEKLATRR